MEDVLNSKFDKYANAFSEGVKKDPDQTYKNLKSFVAKNNHVFSKSQALYLTSLGDQIFDIYLNEPTKDSLEKAFKLLDWQSDTYSRHDCEQEESIIKKGNNIFEAAITLENPEAINLAYKVADWVWGKQPDDFNPLTAINHADKIFNANIKFNTSDSLDKAWDALRLRYKISKSLSDEDISIVENLRTVEKADEVIEAFIVIDTRESLRSAQSTMNWQYEIAEEMNLNKGKKAEEITESMNKLKNVRLLKDFSENFLEPNKKPKREPKPKP